MSYCRMANKILAGQKVKRRKPWAMIKNGDLWQQFEGAVAARGRSTMTVTWVKGHATKVHIDKGITTAAHKLGNDEADALAEQGVKLKNDILELAWYYQIKQQALTRITIRIHDMFLRVLKADQDMRKETEDNQRAQRLLETGMAQPSTLFENTFMAPAPGQGMNAAFQMMDIKQKEATDTLSTLPTWGTGTRGVCFGIRVPTAQEEALEAATNSPSTLPTCGTGTRGVCFGTRVPIAHQEGWGSG